MASASAWKQAPCQAFAVNLTSPHRTPHRTPRTARVRRRKARCQPAPPVRASFRDALMMAVARVNQSESTAISCGE